MVRGGDVAARRVQLARQILAEPVPLVLAGAGHRAAGRPSPCAIGVSAAGRHEMLPSTSPQIRFSVGAFQYIAASRNSRQFRACASRSPPRYGAVPGSCSRRPQRVGAVPRLVLEEDRPVPAELQLDDLAAPSLDLDLFADDPQRLPRAVEPHLVRVRRVHLLDVHVFLIGADDRQPPGDPLVVSDRDADKRRLARADRRSSPAPAGGRCSGAKDWSTSRCGSLATTGLPVAEQRAARRPSCCCPAPDSSAAPMSPSTAPPGAAVLRQHRRARAAPPPPPRPAAATTSSVIAETSRPVGHHEFVAADRGCARGWLRPTPSSRHVARELQLGAGVAEATSRAARAVSIVHGSGVMPVTTELDRQAVRVLRDERVDAVRRTR